MQKLIRNNKKIVTTLVSLFYFFGIVISILFRGKVFHYLIIIFYLTGIIVLVLQCKSKINKFFLAFCNILSIITLSFSTFFTIMRIDGTSMEPVLKDGSLLFVWQQDFEVKRNDTVLLEIDDELVVKHKLLFKRVVGLPGDYISLNTNEITINRNEKYYINDTAWFLIVNMLDENNCIKEGLYFVVGNSKNSYDSKYFGLINKSQILGKVLFI